MRIEFLTAGYSEDLFWSLTPTQVEAHFTAARRRMRVERNMLMETAYLGANAANFKKPLKLDDLILPVDDKPRTKQTPEQRLAVASAWAAAMNRK
jgi:hypothetical protein